MTEIKLNKFKIDCVILKLDLLKFEIQVLSINKEL